MLASLLNRRNRELVFSEVIAGGGMENREMYVRGAVVLLL